MHFFTFLFSQISKLSCHRLAVKLTVTKSINRIFSTQLFRPYFRCKVTSAYRGHYTVFTNIINVQKVRKIYTTYFPPFFNFAAEVVVQVRLLTYTRRLPILCSRKSAVLSWIFHWNLTDSWTIVSSCLNLLDLNEKTQHVLNNIHKHQTVTKVLPLIASLYLYDKYIYI